MTTLTWCKAIEDRFERTLHLIWFENVEYVIEVINLTVQRDILKFPPISQNSFRPAEAAEMMDSIVKDLRIQGKTDAIVVLDKKIQPEFKAKNDQKHAQEAVIANYVKDIVGIEYG